jgi:hypothetical protein
LAEAGIALAKQLGRPAGRAAEKIAKVANALAKGLSVAEMVTVNPSFGPHASPGPAR